MPISEPAYGYAREVRGALRKLGLHVDADCSDRKMQKKVGPGCVHESVDNFLCATVCASCEGCVTASCRSRWGCGMMCAHMRLD